MRAARVVPDHAAQRAAILGGRIGRKEQSILRGLRVQPALHNSALDRSALALRVNRLHRRHVARKVHHQRGIAGLSRKARASAACHNGDAVLTSQRHSADHILGMPRADHAHRNPAVVRGVGRIRRKRACLKAHVAFDDAPHLRCKACQRRHSQPRLPRSAFGSIRELCSSSTPYRMLRCAAEL